MAISTFVKFGTQSLLGAIAIATAIGIGSPADAYTIFFGEDLGLGEATRLPSTPNADAARDSFLSNLVGVGTETFESFAPGTTPPLAINFIGAGTANLQGDGSVENVPTGTNGVGRYPISGNQYFETSSGNFSVDLTEPIAAFGFYGIDIGDFEGQLTLTLANGGTETLTVPNTILSPGGSVLYYGIIASDESEVFTQVTFGNTASGVDFFGFDDLTIGSLEQVNVPEPTSMLGILGFGAFGAASLLKRKQLKGTFKA